MSPLYADSQQQRHCLNDHIPAVLFILSRAEDQQNAKYGGRRAKSQQHQIRLLEKIRQNGFQTIYHIQTPFAKGQNSTDTVYHTGKEV